MDWNPVGAFYAAVVAIACFAAWASTGYYMEWWLAWPLIAMWPALWIGGVIATRLEDSREEGLP